MLILILVLLLLFGGGGFYGYRSGWYGVRASGVSWESAFINFKLPIANAHFRYYGAIYAKGERLSLSPNPPGKCGEQG